ncbi:MAG: putative metal-binding motif-containing protein [Deltaproteobacteria bacterium]|nr:putative metal-binding motif-containing protein [Deltaproteobacteria bacterium]
MHRTSAWLLVAAATVVAGAWLGCADDGSCVPEVCNGLDDDCDGATDEELEESCSTACGDGVRQCVGGRWGTCSARQPTDEVCDGLDNDCDTETDEGGTRWYPDADEDGYGASVGAIESCQQPTGYVSNRDDCDDGAADVHPGATETCDGRDEDCNGTADEGCDCIAGQTQPCGEWGELGECELGEQSCAAGAWGECTGGVRPAEETCNGLDDDCDGTTDEGLTGDGLEPNDTCETARGLETAVEQDARTPLHTPVVETTLYRADGTPDVDWYRVEAEEHSAACVPWTTECCYRFTVLLYPPVGMPREDLRLCVYQDGSCGAFPSELCVSSMDWNSTEGAYETTACWSGTCAYDDGKTFYLRVDSPAGASSCLPYRLRYSFYQLDSDC